jgi:tripartite-type tricarboxylate transporter receptor subunit TctC
MTVFRYLIAVLAFIVVNSGTQAQDRISFPGKPVRLIVPAAPGGPVDTVARILADALKGVWREPVLVESKPGAGNSTGALYVAQSPPDGYTLLVISDSITVNPSLYPNLSKDPLTQFEPISVLVMAPQLLIARTDLEASNLSEFIALANTKKPPMNVASAGAGTISHLTQVLLEQRTGIRSSHIPYRGAAPAVTAVLGKHVDAAWVMPAPTMSYVAEGQLKAIAVTSAKRDAKLPQVPTAEESGLPDFQIMNWQGLFAPANTPKAIIEEISRVVADALQKPEVRARMALVGFEPRGGGAAEAAELVRTNVARWSDVVARAGIKVSN